MKSYKKKCRHHTRRKHKIYNRYKTQKKYQNKNSNKNKKLKKNKIGGELRNNCSANPEKFPKCGIEGCVYLNDKDTVTKQQWKNYNEMPGYGLSLQGQHDSSKYAPNIISTDVKPCDLISKKGLENTAPCFLKRLRNTRKGKQILYEEEKRNSWCRNYGVKNQCIVDEQMYNNFKKNKL